MRVPSCMSCASLCRTMELAASVGGCRLGLSVTQDVLSHRPHLPPRTPKPRLLLNVPQRPSENRLLSTRTGPTAHLYPTRLSCSHGRRAGPLHPVSPHPRIIQPSDVMIQRIHLVATASNPSPALGMLHVSKARIVDPSHEQRGSTPETLRSRTLASPPPAP